MKKMSLLLLGMVAINLNAQIRNNDVHELPQMDQGEVRHEMRIPNIEGYQTLKCDFHIHTVFSDGKVWPDVRINEAWQEGLDAIAMTDHIEYRPHSGILQGDHNESFNIAKRRADEVGFILIKGAEITREKPIGHLNALFITDANALDVKEPLDAIDNALKQGAFIMWNHPGWPDDKSTMYPVHEQLIKDKKIHGVEVFNYTEYYPVSFDWCRQHNLTFLGNSDIHDPIAVTYGKHTHARPLTLVFATERSEKGIKDALFAGRTVVMFNHQLAGKEEYLLKLIDASLKVKKVPGREGLIEVQNISDIPFQMVNEGKLYNLYEGKTLRMWIPKNNQVTVTNCHTAAGKNLQFTLPKF